MSSLSVLVCVCAFMWKHVCVLAIVFVRVCAFTRVFLRVRVCFFFFVAFRF